MKKIVGVLAVALVLGLTACPALAEGEEDNATATTVKPAPEPSLGQSLAKLGGAVAASVVVIGGGLSISKISAKALDGVARQPEAAAQMFLAWLLPAAMIEGAMLFGLVICMMVIR